MALPSNKLITINDRAARTATTFGSVSAGGANMVFIKKLTASSSGTLSFVDGASSVVLDDTYKEYLFTFNNIHPQTDGKRLTFNVSIDTGSNYNVTKTTTFFQASVGENGADGALAYQAGNDLAQGTGFHQLISNVGGDNDQCGSGSITLFNPSSTTFVKHFISRCSSSNSGDYLQNDHTAGYANTTSAVDAVQFKMDSGNIDAGVICLYGIA